MSEKKAKKKKLTEAEKLTTPYLITPTEEEKKAPPTEKPKGKGKGKKAAAGAALPTRTASGTFTIPPAPAFVEGAPTETVFIDVYSDASKDPDLGEEVVSEEYINAKIDDPKFVRSILENERELILWKLEQYDKEKFTQDREVKQADDRYERLKARISEDHLKEEAEALSRKLVNQFRLNDIIARLEKREKDLKKITDAHIEAKQTELKSIVKYITDTLLGDARSSIRNRLFSYIIVFSRGPDLFINSFINNIILMGGAGVGKSTVAKVLGAYFKALGILIEKDVNNKKPSDIIAGYVGQTAPLTRQVLLDSLEKVLFIDEAYAVTGCKVPPNNQYENQFGLEAINTIVDFLSEHQGMTVMILAGYEDKMVNCFLQANEGLPRRFGTQVLLANYSTKDLYKILYKSVVDKARRNIFTEEIWAQIAGLLAQLQADTHGVESFKNQAGDMQNLADQLVSVNLMVGGEDPKEKKTSPNPNIERKHIIYAFNEFLRSKGKQIMQGKDQPFKRPKFLTKREEKDEAKVTPSASQTSTLGAHALPRPARRRRR